MIGDGPIGDDSKYTFYDFDGQRFRLVRSFSSTDPELRKRLCGYGVPAFPSARGL